MPASLWAIVTFREHGRYANVGMNTRLPMSGCTTERGYLRRCATYKQPYRIEFFRRRLFDGESYKTLYSPPYTFEDGSRSALD